MQKIDVKDKKILKELLLNSRIPITRLSRTVGVSREVALYRLKKLQKSIIRKFHAIIDTQKLGFNRHACFVQFKGVTSLQENKIINSIANHDNITYLGQIIGRWNVSFDILSKDNLQLKTVVEDITRNISENIDNYIVAGTPLTEEIFPTKIVGVVPSAIKQKEMKEQHVSDKIDSIDKQILAMLSDDARIEYTKISQKLELTANSIKYRIKNLEKLGIIQGYSISFNLKELGFDFYNLQLKINQDCNSKKLISFLRAHPNVLYYYQYLGHENWDIDVGIIAKDSVKLREFMLDLKKNHPNTVKVFDLYIITEEIKPNKPSKNLIKSC